MFDAITRLLSDLRFQQITNTNLGFPEVELINSCYEELRKIKDMQEEYNNLVKLVKPNQPHFEFYDEDGRIIDTVYEPARVPRAKTIETLRYYTKKRIERVTAILNQAKREDFKPVVPLHEIIHIPIDALKIDEFT